MNRSRILRLLFALAVFGLAGYLLRGYFTDDTIIHLRYVDNLLERGEFSFNPGLKTYGATSPLWIFGLAFLVKLGLAPLTAAWVLGALSGILLILAADTVIERLTFAPSWKFVVILLVVSDVWFLRWTFSGMETPLATALLVLMLMPLIRKPSTGRMWPRYLVWGVGAGLAGLVRPEFMVMVPLALPFLLWFEYFRASGMDGMPGRRRARPHAPALAAVAGWLLVTVPWMMFAWFSFGRIIPETAAAKSIGFSLSPGDWFPSLYRSVGMLAISQGFLWVGVGLLVLLILWRHRSLENFEDGQEEETHLSDDENSPGQGVGPWSVWGPVAMVCIAVTWTAVLLGGLALRQVWVISRYVSPLAPVILLALSVVVEWLMLGAAVTVGIRRTARVIILVAVMASLVTNGWMFTTKVIPHAKKFPAGVHECYFELGQWLRDNTPEDTLVAALDIGAIGYRSERRILDLMGLVSPEILELGREQGFEAMVASGAWLEAGDRMPDYLVDRSEGRPRWDGKTVRGVRFELLDTCIIEGLGLNEPQPWTVALYRLVPVETGVRSSSGG